MSNHNPNPHTHAGAPKTAGAPHGRTPRIRGEEIIVLCFALLGFLGSVYLYRTGSPSIIVSIFLATGVASLVYKFLGGLQNATFVWGALKLGGAAAALLGIAFGVDHYLKTESPAVFPTEGLYEWQWAGEGLIGYVEVAEDGTAKFEMNQFATCGAQRKELLHMKQSGAGRAVWIDNRTKLRVKIPFQYVSYDANCNETSVSEEEILEGDLTAVPAFAGKIHYRSKNNSPIGDMILVKTISGVH